MKLKAATTKCVERMHEENFVHIHQTYLLKAVCKNQCDLLCPDRSNDMYECSIIEYLFKDNILDPRFPTGGQKNTQDYTSGQ